MDVLVTILPEAQPALSASEPQDHLCVLRKEAHPVKGNILTASQLWIRHQDSLTEPSEELSQVTLTVFFQEETACRKCGAAADWKNGCSVTAHYMCYALKITAK